MAPQSPETWPTRLRAVLRYGIFGLILFSPLPFGSVRPGALLVLQLCGCALGLLAVWLVLAGAVALSRKARFVLALSLAVLALGLLQLAPLPHDWASVLGSHSVESRQAVVSLVPQVSTALAPLTVSPPSTVDAVCRFATYILIGLAAAVGVRTCAELKQAGVVIALAGALQALYGSAEYLSGHQHIFGFAKVHFLDSATGTFINRNHFAGYLAMTLPFALSLVVVAHRRRPIGASLGQKLAFMTQPSGFGLIAGGLAAAIIWVGLIVSYSRGGLAAALSATAWCIFAASSGRTRVALVAALLLPTVLLLGQEIRAPGERFATTGDELLSLNGRLPVWKASLPIAADYAPVGSGLGTFESVFPRYRPPEIRLLWDHAHNDWLESATEGGPLVTAAMLAILCGCLTGIRDRSRGSGAASAVYAAMAAAIAAIALHSLADFCLRIPAIAVLASCLVGLSCSDSPLSPPVEFALQSSAAGRRRPGFGSCPPRHPQRRSALRVYVDE